MGWVGGEGGLYDLSENVIAFVSCVKRLEMHERSTSVVQFTLSHG